MKLPALEKEYGAWLSREGYAEECGEEIMLDPRLTAAQRTWLSDFIKRWEVAEAEDDVIRDRIWEEAEQAAIHGYGPGGSSATNPYPSGSGEAESWDYAFRNAYARQNGK